MVIFEDIRYKNFMSVGNQPITIYLNKSKTTLISAVNGVGKSILLDAICFVLFGRAYRNINKPQLINSINLKQSVVDINFSVGTKKYRVVRGMKPAVFEIYENGVLINQDPNVKDYQKVLEQQILKMNFRAFTQVVVMGSAAYVPFMKLKTGERREFIEDLLDIRVFSVMNKLLAQKTKEDKDTLKSIDNQLVAAKGVIAVIEEHIDTRSKEKNERIQSVKDEIDAINITQQEAYDERVALDEKYLALKPSSDKHSTATKTLDSLLDAKGKCEVKIASLHSEIGENESLEHCRTCSQSLTDEIRQRFNSSARESLPKYEKTLTDILAKISKLEPRLAALSDDIVKSSALITRITELNRIEYGNQLVIEKLNKELKSLIAIPTVDSEKDRLREYAKKVVDLDKQRSTLRDDLRLQDAASLMLHDTGIKSKIIKQYIPLINKLVNRYLSKLDFFCQFTLDEGFNEIVKSRHRDTFSYDSFSQGEKQRIDLSLIFAWREISALKNSVHTNLIIMDEMLDSAVDASGMELCFDLISSMQKSNIFVVSHRDGVSDKFDATIKLIKKNNFTEIVK